MRYLTCVIRSAAMLRPRVRFSTSSLAHNKQDKQDKQDIDDDIRGISPDENGLYYGKFTREEYDDAAKYVTQQYDQLAKSIKGDRDVRENLASMQAFPTIDRTPGGKIALDNLTNIFEQTIKTTGPMSLSAFMRQCLTHPQFGYYTTRDPLDPSSGDFITSPEISSMFGEMVGIWLYSTWLKQGKPTSIRVVEFGPGKGTLVHDTLRTFNKFSQNAVHVEIVLIEASPVLRHEQWKLLCRGDFETTPEKFNKSSAKWGDGEVWWVDNEKDLDLLPSSASKPPHYVLAHEFFDALPIKSFVKKEAGWRELVVEHSPSVENTQATLPPPTDESAQSTHQPSANESAQSDDLLNPQFHLTLSPKETPSSMIPKLNPRYADLPLESRIEICPDSEFYIMKMAQLLAGSDAGAVLIIDYGLASGIPENSLRGIYKHRFVSPFIKPGDVDLSIDVDFENLKLLSSKHADVFGPVEQGDWLHECGIGYRADQLLKAETDYDKQEKVYNAYQRLTSKDDKGMGKIYKFLCLMPKNSHAPVGFGGSA